MKLETDAVPFACGADKRKTMCPDSKLLRYYLSTG